MDCRAFKTRLNEALDARRSPDDDPGLVAHALVCSHCQDVKASYEALLMGAQGLSAVPSPRRNLAPLVVEEMRRSSQRAGWTWAVAAAALVALSAGLWSRQAQVGPGEAGSRQAQVASRLPQQAGPISLEEGPWSSTSNDGVQVLARVTGRMAGDFVSVRGGVWVDPVVVDGLPEVRDTMTAAIARLRQAQLETEQQSRPDALSPADPRVTSAGGFGCIA